MSLLGVLKFARKRSSLVSTDSRQESAKTSSLHEPIRPLSTTTVRTSLLKRSSDLASKAHKSTIPPRFSDLTQSFDIANPLFCPSSLPHSFEQAIHQDFNQLLEFARSQHAEESLAFWLAVEEFKHAAAGEETKEEEVFHTNTSSSSSSSVRMSDRVSYLKHALLQHAASAMNVSSSSSTFQQQQQQPPTSPPPMRSSSFQALSLAAKHTIPAKDQYITQRKRRLLTKKEESEKLLLCGLTANLKLKTNLSPAALELASDIFVEFLEENAIKEISLNEPIAKELNWRREEGLVDISMFDDAQKLVFSEMKMNLYPGYLNHLRQRRIRLTNANAAAEAAATFFRTRGDEDDDDKESSSSSRQ